MNAFPFVVILTGVLVAVLSVLSGDNREAAATGIAVVGIVIGLLAVLPAIKRRGWTEVVATIGGGLVGFAFVLEQTSVPATSWESLENSIIFCGAITGLIAVTWMAAIPIVRRFRGE